eukprot:740703-Rhodomonas_salina.1
MPVPRLFQASLSLSVTTSAIATTDDGSTEEVTAGARRGKETGWNIADGDSNGGGRLDSDGGRT